MGVKVKSMKKNSILITIKRGVAMLLGIFLVQFLLNLVGIAFDFSKISISANSGSIILAIIVFLTASIVLYGAIVELIYERVE